MWIVYFYYLFGIKLGWKTKMEYQEIVIHCILLGNIVLQVTTDSHTAVTIAN